MSIRLRDAKVTCKQVESDFVHTIASESVELCACGGNGGEAKAFLPVKILSSDGNNPSVATISELKVSSDTQSNSRGVRRVMVKVELPYQSLPEADVRASGGIVDSRRSGQPITAHIVVSLPRTAAEDLTGSRGTDAQKAALAQVRGVLSLLLAFTSPEMAGAVEMTTFDPTSGDIAVPKISSIPEDGTFTLPDDALHAYTTLRAGLGTAKIVPDALNGQTGLSFVDLADAPLNAYEPLWRGLLGQKPMTCNQEVTLPKVATLIAI